MPSLGELLKKTTGALEKISDNPAMEAEILLADCLKRDRAYVLAHLDKTIDSNDCRRCDAWLKRRSTGQPLAYLRGWQDFYGRRFRVNRHTLIPRPESELLIDLLLKQNITQQTLIVDVGSGSGCLAITAANLTAAQIIGIDISSAALRVAKINNRLSNNRVVFMRGDLLQPLLKKSGLNDLQQLIILANLPYLPSRRLTKLNSPATIGLRFEPINALDGGSDGLKLYRRLSRQIQEIVKKAPQLKITILAEIDPSQQKSISPLFRGRTQIFQDYSHRPRAAIIEISRN